MLFHSLEFLIFFIIVYTLYLFLDHKKQNIMLLIASYIFYGFWDWRFLSLMFVSTVIDFYCGRKIDLSDNAKIRKKYLILSVIGNLIILGFFKYFNFFVSNLVHALNIAGLDINYSTLNIILPLGISFYTLQSLSYTIDIYRKGMKHTNDFLSFCLFVSFFPQLVAGPIERARNLLPQMLSKREITLEKFYSGCYMVFWGIFLKAFIADNLANMVDPVFVPSPVPYNGIEVLLVSYAFSIQIFCDFAGYSSVARGLARMMGFELMVNFNLPYFATSIQDFWNRWHISLSSWVRDYIYMPLFFSIRRLKGNLKLAAVIMITMAIMGLWHGANWIFVVWGLYHGSLLAIYMFTRKYIVKWINPKSKWGQSAWLWIRIIFVFHLATYGMLIFRAEWGMQIWLLTKAMLFNFTLKPGLESMLFNLLSLSWVLIVVQLIEFKNNDLLYFYKQPVIIRAALYTVCFLLMIIGGAPSGKEFIYFQF